MIHDIKVKYNFYVIILYFNEKSIEMIIVWLLQRAVPNNDVFIIL